MAKHKQLWLKGSKGKLAGTTFYQTAGVTIQREINYDPSNPRTDKQMTQRTKLANLVNMYRAGKSFFPRAFENKKALESDYNKFVSYNLTNSPIFLTKGEAAKGYFYPAAYIVSQGSLVQPGSMVNTNGVLKYDVVSGGSMSANTTVAQYTAALQAIIPEVQDGDQLSLIMWGGSTPGFFSKAEIILSSEDTRKLSDLDLGQFAWEPANGFVTDTSGELTAGGVILSRTVAGKTLVSSCTLDVYTGATDYTAHTGATAQAAAINSYGASKKVFLDNK